MDQDAIPTLVEVKRSSDTRLRREVVGQMLDYAANVAAYWPSNEVRSIYEARCAAAGLDADGSVIDLVGGLDDSGLDTESESFIDDFWQRVDANIRSRRLRLVFVADSIPRELQSIIEFLNENLVHADVLGVEVKQYVGEARQTLVPRVIGWTAAAEEVKESASKGRKWDRESFEEAVREGLDEAGVARQMRLLAWAEERRLLVWWSHSTVPGWVPIDTDTPDLHQQIFRCVNDRHIEVYFQHLANKGPFVVEDRRRELRDRLNAIDGIVIDETSLAGRPRVELLAVSDRSFDELLGVFDWVVDVLREPQPAAG